MKQQKVLLKSLSQKNIIFNQEHKAVGTKEYHQA